MTRRNGALALMLAASNMCSAIKYRSHRLPNFMFRIASQIGVDSGGIQAHGCTITPSLIINSIIDHGPYQANRTQIHRRQGPTQTARHQGSSQVCPGQDEDDTMIDETTMSNVTTRTTTTRTGTQQRGCEDEDDTRSAQRTGLVAARWS